MSDNNNSPQHVITCELKIGGGDNKCGIYVLQPQNVERDYTGISTRFNKASFKKRLAEVVGITNYRAIRYDYIINRVSKDPTVTIDEYYFIKGYSYAICFSTIALITSSQDFLNHGYKLFLDHHRDLSEEVLMKLKEIDLTFGLTPVVVKQVLSIIPNYYMLIYLYDFYDVATCDKLHSLVSLSRDLRYEEQCELDAGCFDIRNFILDNWNNLYPPTNPLSIYQKIPKNNLYQFTLTSPLNDERLRKEGFKDFITDPMDSLSSAKFGLNIILGNSKYVQRFIRDDEILHHIDDGISFIKFFLSIFDKVPQIKQKA